MAVHVEDKLREIDKIRRDFVANVSHELRTPLTVLRGYLELLLDSDQTPEQETREIYQQMLSHSNRMHHVIKDLLLLSQLESNNTLYRTDLIDIHTMLHATVESLESMSRSKSQNITIQSEEPVGLIGSTHEIQSLITNLIVNAINYTPEGGQIKVFWDKVDNQSILRVKDNGIGIAKKHILRLTERFYRVDKARSRDQGGTGLGLAIVKHVLMCHSGKLLIKSKLKVGSEFICQFPRERVSDFR